MPLKRANFPTHLVEVFQDMRGMWRKAHFVTAITVRYGPFVDRYRSVRFSRSTFLRNDLEPRACGASFYRACAHGAGLSSGANLSARRSCGKAHIQISITAIVPKPPISADGTAPNAAATAPARNSPSAPDDPVNMELTANTRPSMSCGVRICTSDCRMTTLIASEAP